MGWAITAIRRAFPLDGATIGTWASAGTAGIWAGAVDGITLIMPVLGAGADIPTTVAPIGVRTRTAVGATGVMAVMVVTTAAIQAMVITKTGVQ